LHFPLELRQLLQACCNQDLEKVGPREATCCSELSTPMVISEELQQSTIESEEEEASCMGKLVTC